MPPRVLRELARAAEELGYRTAWLPDHILPPGEYGATFGGVYEPLVTIGHLAGLTERLRFGTSVLIVPLRNPFVLAKQVATLQELSEGRMILGAGVGWSEPEFIAVGAEFRRRGADTDEALALLQHLFSGGTSPYPGPGFPYQEGIFAPVPATAPGLVIGGNSTAALRRAARFGTGWQGLPDGPERFAERSRALAAMTERPVEATVRIQWDGTTPVQQAADEVSAYRAAGAASVAVHFGDHEGTSARMEQLARAVERAG